MEPTKLILEIDNFIKNHYFKVEYHQSNIEFRSSNLSENYLRDKIEYYLTQQLVKNIIERKGVYSLESEVCQSTREIIYKKECYFFEKEEIIKLLYMIKNMVI